MTTTDEVRQQPGSNRRTGALLTAMGIKEPPASQEVVGLMGRREQMMRMDSAATQVFCTQCDVEDQGEHAEAQAQLSGLQRLLAQRQNLQMAISLMMQRLLALWHMLQKVLQSVQRKRVPVLLQLS